MTLEVLAHVRRFADAHCGGINLSAMHLLGTSGTVTTIAGLYLRLKRYDRRQVDGCWMIPVAIRNWFSAPFSPRIACQA